ncbi:FKBP-type peptidyl-prolyl cis-trans isomerase [Candidiatus Paracoxiella cheracis]|uniref:FKBP-type peptidyl-prolyl cis-trans isomerase n=1 Tax=Candidiatus Paracoxiella cheracis TaxID=3405120 RepID=UPI003BF5B566
MKRLLVALLGGSLVASVAVAQAATPIKTQQDKLSYSMGVMTGRAFKTHDIQVSPTAFAAGLSDGITGNKTQMTDAQIRATLENFQKESMKKMQAQMEKLGKQNAQKGAQFLAVNKAKKGIVTTANGLQYKVLKAGHGSSPSLKDVVTVNYEGKLIDGKVFDSSYRRGKPATFPVNTVIKGWQEALTKMKPGAIWEIYIPAKLAYGMQGAPGVIGPNETLIFKVNLISVKKDK